MKSLSGLCLGLVSVLLAACSGPAPQQAADVIFSGGDILTMAGDQPQYVEALAVKDGHIVLAGSLADAQKLAGKTTQQVQLNGRTLLPGFIDAHGHIADYTNFWGKPDFSPPPVGDTRSIEDIKTKLAKYLIDSKATADKLVLVNGYDDSLLAEQRHPTRADLDQVSSTIPVLMLHASGHIAVVNTPALALVKLGKDSKDPPGGHMQRDRKSGELNGVLEETAIYPFIAVIHSASVADQITMLGEIQSWYASFGLTTAQDGISSPASVALLQEADKQHKLVLDIVAYPMWKTLGTPAQADANAANLDIHLPGSEMNNEGRLSDKQPLLRTPVSLDAPVKERLKVGVYGEHFKIGGIKITADGSPQGKTAYVTKPYELPPAGQGKDYRGYPTLEQDELNEWLDVAYKNDVQVLVHTNGDAAVDQLLQSVALAQAKYPGKDLRPVSIHAQLARHDQVDAMQKLGIVPSFFSAHTFFWGDWHVQSFGKERAYGISPMNYASSKPGFKFTNHNDAPVVPPNMMFLAWTAVNRQSRSGQTIGPDERVSPYIAFKAMTDYAAYQYFEEKTKGTLEAGKLADLVILDANPLKVEPLAIKDIKVLETLKAGKTIYKAQ
jgi:predicted amidohydrolase YtcJ